MAPVVHFNRRRVLVRVRSGELVDRVMEVTGRGRGKAVFVKSLFEGTEYVVNNDEVEQLPLDVARALL